MIGSFGGASVDLGLFYAIRSILPNGKTILELGSGYGTQQLVKHYMVYSIEDDKKWLDKYHDHYIYAPRTAHKEVRGHLGNTWYDREVIIREVPKIRYDLLLVDGPPYERAGLLKYLDFFDLSVPMVFDDIDRDNDRKILTSVAGRLRAPFVVYGSGGGAKLYGIINDPRLKI